jgi:hypothetical protein
MLLSLVAASACGVVIAREILRRLNKKPKAQIKNWSGRRAQFSKNKYL